MVELRSDDVIIANCAVNAAILDSVADGVFTVDSDWRITSFNRAAELITRFPREQAIGMPCSEVFKASICNGNCALRRTIENGQPLVNVPVEIRRRDGERIPISISTAVFHAPDGGIAGGVETFRDLSVLENLKRSLDSQQALGEIIGHHPRLAEVLEILPTLAQSDATLLIEGPSGSGKGLLASAVHEMSPRRERNLVKVSCAALPETLLESELFGYVKGAFTDARRDKPGRIALAQGGTLFLDEIGDLTPAMQVKLLRVVQERQYEPLGSSRTLSADVRVIAATHRDLRAMVRKGSFREDLYYRLAVVRLTLPSLAERREDIPLLVERFVARLRARTGKRITGVAEETLHLLMAHEFPGNVRELENAIEHAFVLCAGEIITPQHLPREIREGGSPLTATDPLTARDRAEADVIREAMDRAGGNRVAAARALGMHRTTLWRKIRQYQIRDASTAGRGRR